MIENSNKRVFLLPGEYHITKNPKIIATLLGSCVAVCLYNEINRSAGMNHYLQSKAPSPDERNVGKYGDLSIKYMIDTLFTLDPNPDHYKAKIFGGGNVVGHLGIIGLAIGEKNIFMAKKILLEHKIPIIENHTGGMQGRKVYFDTSTFKVRTELVGKERKDFSKNKIKVLVVDDSPLVRNILSQAISQTPGMEVVGQAQDAYEARDLLLSTDPDVISLDIVMPKIDGLKFLDKIMCYSPKPVVIVSTIAKKMSKIAFKAKQIGAVEVIDKDQLQLYNGTSNLQTNYIPALRTAAAQAVHKIK